MFAPDILPYKIVTTVLTLVLRLGTISTHQLWVVFVQMTPKMAGESEPLAAFRILTFILVRCYEAWMGISVERYLQQLSNKH